MDREEGANSGRGAAKEAGKKDQGWTVQPMVRWAKEVDLQSVNSIETLGVLQHGSDMVT